MVPYMMVAVVTGILVDDGDNGDGIGDLIDDCDNGNFDGISEDLNYDSAFLYWFMMVIAVTCMILWGRWWLGKFDCFRISDESCGDSDDNEDDSDS